ncbi:LIC12162 family protein, partial [Paracoccaceae bacterium]|nr:LIC12162 family protein [Paracoccaceae bacterium]
NKRNWNIDSRDHSVDLFEKIARKFIPNNIPTCYLENYKDLLLKTMEQNWPPTPKVIFTANADIWDDIFKAYTAQKCEYGALLVIGQHGGHYGMTPFYFTEDHQVRISDKWLSWGWSDPLRPKIVSVGNLKAKHKSLKYDPKGTALMVNCAFPRFSYYLYAVPMAGQWLSYYENQKLFINILPKHIREKLVVKLYPTDYGWDQEQRYSNEIKGVKISNDNETVPFLVRRSRLYISTYNATTYLESLTSNIPTVIFWDTKQWEIKADTLPYFELLKKVGIFHSSAESAALHISKVWDDIPAWWESDVVQQARAKFCKKYSHKPKNIVKDIGDIFHSLTRS